MKDNSPDTEPVFIKEPPWTEPRITYGQLCELSRAYQHGRIKTGVVEMPNERAINEWLKWQIEQKAVAEHAEPT